MAPPEHKKTACHQCQTNTTCFHDASEQYDADGDGKIDEHEKGGFYCEACWTGVYGSPPEKGGPSAGGGGGGGGGGAWGHGVGGGGGGGSDMPTWTKVYDSGSESYYFFNNYTSENVWDQPFDFVEPPSGSAAAFLMNPELKAAMLIQRIYRKKQARRVLRAKK